MEIPPKLVTTDLPPIKEVNIIPNGLEQAKLRDLQRLALQASEIRVLQRQYEELEIKIDRIINKMETLDRFTGLHGDDLKDIHSIINTIENIIGRKHFKLKK
jgi:uncharacterized protein YjcR